MRRKKNLGENMKMNLLLNYLSYLNYKNYKNYIYKRKKEIFEMKGFNPQYK